MKHKLIGVVGEDVEEFGYLLGKVAKMHANDEQKTISFDDLTIMVTTKRKNGDTLVVKSKLGNKFTFREVV